MYTNSHLYNLIACLKFFHKARKTMFYYPETTEIIVEFLNLLWRSGVIGGYTSGQTKYLDYDRYKLQNNFGFEKLFAFQYNYLIRGKVGLLVQIKSPRYRVDSVSLEIISKSARPTFLTYFTMNHKNKQRLTQNSLYLNTVFGFISSDEIFVFDLKIGGLLLGRSL